MRSDFESSSAAPSSYERSFAVGVTTTGISGGGHLRVAPNVLVCELGPAVRKISGVVSVRHKDNCVHIYKARLIPFWFNASVLITDGQTKVGASMWSFGLRTLTRVLKEADFDVVLHRTWVFRGLTFADLSGTHPNGKR
jgi:hypothetical protein